MDSLKVNLRQWRADFTAGLYRGNATPALQDAIERYFIDDFMRDEVGAAYNVTRDEKEQIVASMRHARANIITATSWLSHLVMGQRILEVPPEVEGSVIECGCYKGGSTANLSRVCDRVGRKLYVCDSFEGLPEDDESEHRYAHFQIYGAYESGMYAGALEEVQGNVEKYGCIDACRFVKGWFSDTLPSVEGPFVLAFADVDLVSSLTDCMVNLWPKLVDNGYFFTDDSADLATVRLWFDDAWWAEHIGEGTPPGYVGSGCGLPVTPQGSSLGYAHKVVDPSKVYNQTNWLRYPTKNEESGEGGDS